MLKTDNATFTIKNGLLTINPSPEFTAHEVLKLLKLAVMHCRYKKIKKPTHWNKWWLIQPPTLTVTA